MLVFGGTVVAVGAILSRPTAGAAYDSLSVALAFGLALAAVVGAIEHVSGAHVNPTVTMLARSWWERCWGRLPPG
jgi:glycerol uptake facilitator-like aquaporin